MQACHTFRIFISSTFRGLHQERDALQQYVFPRLRDLCLQNNTRFQAIDLRWGVSEEAALNQQTVNICLSEIERCQHASGADRRVPRPNFIVLLGDRYGWCPPPPLVRAGEFEPLRGLASLEDQALLDDWYERDDNAVPPAYYLKGREGPLRDFERWDPVEHRLRAVLLNAATQAGLPAAARDKYQVSVTEQEILKGVLAQPEARDHVFGFFRTISGLPNDRSAEEFLDLGADDPTWCRGRLSDLKARLAGHPLRHIDEYQASWTGGGITTDHIGTLPARLEDCLGLIRALPFEGSTTLCVDVWRRLSSVILAELDTLKSIESTDAEIEAHKRFAEDVAPADVFTGRTSILDRISRYIDAPDARPLVIHGLSGCGKSALMARAAQLAEAEEGAAVVIRFIGASPQSSDIRSLLTGLCRQLAGRYETPRTAVPAAYQDLVDEFRRAITAARQPLILFLDGLDQLSDADDARNLIWLPTSGLPDHVRVIVSTMSSDCHALKVRLPEESLVELRSMGADDGERLLGLWLAGAQRTLQPLQRAEVLARFADNGGLPLYLKLAFEEARLWKSKSDGPETKLSENGVAGIIEENLLRRLSSEKHHGEVVVERSLGYLAASKNGLSEDELIEVLSIDKGEDEQGVIATFRRRSPRAPKVDTLPIVVWSRLYFDLEPYLTERSADGASLLSFYHRQLGDVVRAKYLQGEGGLARYQDLARYFGDDKLQPLQRKLGAQAVANLRKLSELPYQQTLGELWDRVFDTLTDFAFLERKAADIGVVEGADGARTYTGIYHLQEDFHRALQKRSCLNPELLSILLDALTSSAHLLEREPAALSAQVHNLVYNDIGDGAAIITSRARAHLASRNWLRLQSRSTPQIRRALTRVLTHGAAVQAVDWVQRTDRLVSAGADFAVKVWNSRTGNLDAVHQLAVKQLYAIALSPDGACLAIATDQGIALIRHATELPSQLVFMPGSSHVVSLAWAPSGELLAYAESGSVKVVEISNASFGRVLTVSKDPSLQPPMSLRWSPSGALLIAASRHGWRLWRARDWSTAHDEWRQPPVTAIGWSPSSDAIAIAFAVARKGRRYRHRQYGLIEVVAVHGDLIQRIDPHTGPVTALAWSPTTDTLATSSTNERDLIYGIGVGMDAVELTSMIKGDSSPIATENLITLWNPRTAVRCGVLPGHRLPVSSLNWSADGTTIVSGSEDGTLRIWRTEFAEQADERSLQQGHLDRISCAAICPSGSTFATASYDTTVRFWDFEGHIPHIVEKGEFSITALAWAPGSHYDLEVAEVGRRAGKLARSDEGMFRRSVRVRDLTSGELVRLPDSSFDVKCLAWSPTGELLAAGGRKVLVWDTRSTRRVLRLDPHCPVASLGWSDDGRWLAWTEIEGQLKIFDRSVGKVTRDLRTHGPAGTIVSWLSGSLLAVGHEDGSVALWDAEEARPRWVSRPASAAVSCLAYLGGQRLVAAGLLDTSLRLLRLASGRPESVVFVASPLLCLRAGASELDAVDDGTSWSAQPRSYKFAVEPSHSPGADDAQVS